MKNFVGLLAILLLLGACSDAPKKEKQLVGNAKDEHGCLVSAGYQWSEAMKDCVRVWEVGENLKSDDKSLYVVFSPDSSVVEVFLGKGETYLCKRQGEQMLWKADKDDVCVTLAHDLLSAKYKGDVYTVE